MPNNLQTMSGVEHPVVVPQKTKRDKCKQLKVCMSHEPLDAPKTRVRNNNTYIQHFMVSLENLFLLSLHICTDDEKRRVIVSYGDDDGRRRMCGNM